LRQCRSSKKPYSVSIVIMEFKRYWLDLNRKRYLQRDVERFCKNLTNICGETT
jgi:hypothetical protein